MSYRFLCLLFLFLPSLSHAEKGVYFAGEGLFPPLQVPSREKKIYGIRINPGFGAHKEVIGLDFGLIGNTTDENMIGFQVAGAFNNNRGSSTILGLQLASLANRNQKAARVIGLQFALGTNIHEGSGSVVGGQFSLFANYAPKTNIYGLQVGLYNRAETVYGFQFGIVNVAEKLYGIQIGLLNYVNKGPIKFLPFLNIGF